MIGVNAVSGRMVLDDIRRRRRGHDPRSLADRFTDLYMGLFVVAYVVASVLWLLSAELPTGEFSLDDTLVWLPLLLFALMWGVLHHATWQGPVLFSAPELQWVLSAPLGRRPVVLTRMLRAFLFAVVAGILGGLMAAIIAATTTDSAFLVAWLASAPAFMAVGFIAVALSWHVERSVTWSVVVLRATPVFVAFGALATYAIATGREVPVLWSGPWGWAAAPLLAASGASAPGWGFGLLLLLVVMIATLVLAVSAAGDYSEEEMWRRAEARSAAAAALFFGDVRTVRRVAKRSRTRGAVRARTAKLIHFRNPMLAIVSRDLQALRRSPGRLAVAVLFTAGGFAAAVAATQRPIFGVLAFLGLYIAGSRLLEPIRVEVEQPDAHLILPWKWGTTMVLHCVVPTLALAILGLLGLAIVTIAGFVGVGALPALVLVTPFTAAAIVTAGAVSASRKPFPVDMMISGADSGAFLVVLWMLAGPVLAGIVVSIAFGGMRDTIDQGITGSAVWAVIALVVGSSGFASWLMSRKAPT
jgi:hypothetical protein